MSKSSKTQSKRSLRPNQMAAHEPTIGVLGGGQLARMLVLEAHRLGLRIAVLSESKDDPAAQVARHWVQGPLNNLATLKRFMRDCSIVTFESEFLDADLLKKAQTELAREHQCEVWPSPEHMALIQDRLTQKQLLERHRISTSPFFVVETKHDCERAWNEFDDRVVFKKRRFGYDGNGTVIVKTRAALRAFTASLTSDTWIAERFVPFRHELAIMIARAQNGSTAVFPWVETHQVDSRCQWVQGPLSRSVKRNFNSEKLEQSLRQFVRDIRYVGILGVEVFEAENGVWLVNELAPRVHNSAHYSLDALDLNQFETHLAAVTNGQLRDPQALSAFAMWNLLGSSTAPASWATPLKTEGQVKLHWYGKQENRAGRKMGHINALAATPERALQLAKNAARSVRI